MYFSNNFPTTYYDPTGSGTYTKVQDILTRIKIKDEVRERNALFSIYNVPNGLSPELVSNRIYGDVEFYWVILMMNKVYNRYYDWPMKERDLQKYIIETYANPDAVHHYEIAQSSGSTRIMIWVESTVVGATAVTNMEHERTLNDNRAKIKILSPTYLQVFVEQFNRLLKNSS
jgi:hypothetical protein